MNYYTYAYLRENGTPYYIGKGSGNRINCNHIRKNGSNILPKDKSKRIILKWFIEEERSYNHEQYMIFILGIKGDGGILINEHYGGKGGFCKYLTDEERKRNERERKNRWQKEYRKKNRDKINKQSVKYYWNNREKNLKYAKEYREKNRETINKKQRENRKK